MVCRKCAGAKVIDRYNPLTKKIETVSCPVCGGSGTVHDIEWN